LKRIFFLLILFYCHSFIKAQDKNYWQQQVNYKIDVTLNDAAHTLDGYVKMYYFNNSPDTLHFIWIHLWPNAYKNDRTAFSDQMLENGSTDFYFSNEDKKGYINRLDFKVNSTTALTTDHPQHQDIIKLILPQPLAPRSNCKIETPFHVKLPYYFSRGGHIDQSYQIAQWYPKPAVYDKKGWHPMPYLDQGEFYSEFGNFEVQITLPKNYVVAATGNLQEQSEKDWLQKRKVFNRDDYLKTKKKNEKNKIKESTILSAAVTKTLHYTQTNVHDFAWFADKTLSVKTDTLQLPSGKTITVSAFYFAENATIWGKSISFIKQAILTKSKWLGEYPYDVISVVEDEKAGGRGMEYPTITYLSSGGSEKDLDLVINHEVGHNWFYGILASHERTHPWMDEGMNTYYDNRYEFKYYGNMTSAEKSPFINKRIPDDESKMILQSIIKAKKDQPVETESEKFNETNYNSIAYTKAGEWLTVLEKELGRDLFDSCMREYYRRWSFKHPYPEDFKKVVEEVSGKNLDAAFALVNKKGNLVNTATKKDIRFSTFFNFKDTDKHNYIFAAPVIGTNKYDRLMIGVLLHNYTLPAAKFQFFLAPLYATGSKQFNGIGALNYHWYPDHTFQKIEIGLNGSRFSSNHSLDTTGKKVFETFYKAVPFVKFHFRHGYKSSLSSWIDIRHFTIGETQFTNYKYKTGSDSAFTYPTAFKTSSRYINQLTLNINNNRVLYPYSLQLQLQQGEGFYRLNATGNYFFNYAKGGGMEARVFAAKFGYAGTKNYRLSISTQIVSRHRAGRLYQQQLFYWPYRLHGIWQYSCNKWRHSCTAGIDTKRWRIKTKVRSIQQCAGL
jgi:Peptidase family M1 domain